MKQHVLGYFLRKQWILLHVGLSSCQPLQADQQTGAQLWSTLIFAERKKKKKNASYPHSPMLIVMLLTSHASHPVLSIFSEISFWTLSQYTLWGMRSRNILLLGISQWSGCNIFCLCKADLTLQLLLTLLYFPLMWHVKNMWNQLRPA